MKKKIKVIMGVFVLVILMGGIVIAMGNINNSKNIPKKAHDKIIEKANKKFSTTCINFNQTDGTCLEFQANITDIDVTISDPDCNGKVCLFHAYSQNVINTKFLIPQSLKKCTLQNITTRECITEVTIIYTDTEIRDFADEHVKDRLASYGDALINREGKTKKTIGGRTKYTNDGR